MEPAEGRGSASLYGKGFLGFGGGGVVVFVRALAKRVRAKEHLCPTMSQDMWVYRAYGSGSVSRRGNGTSVV